LLAVRLKLRLKRGSLVKEALALVNSGYEAETPQLLIPVKLARELRIWPPPSDATETVFGTAGGPLRVWIVPQAAEASVVADDAEPRWVLVDLVVSHMADEPLISDKLADELGIAVESFGRGLWRFTWEPKEKLRKSEKA